MSRYATKFEARPKEYLAVLAVIFISSAPFLLQADGFALCSENMIENEEKRRLNVKNANCERKSHQVYFISPQNLLKKSVLGLNSPSFSCNLIDDLRLV